MGFWKNLFKFGSSKKIKYLLILNDRDVGPGGPTDNLVGRVLGVLNSGSVKENQVIIKSSPGTNHNPTNVQLGMIAMTEFLLKGWSVKLGDIEFFRYSCPEGKGVAIVQFE